MIRIPFTTLILVYPQTRQLLWAYCKWIELCIKALQIIHICVVQALECDSEGQMARRQTFTS